MRVKAFHFWQLRKNRFQKTSARKDIKQVAEVS